MKSNMELYSSGYVYHLHKIKINFLKGEKIVNAYLLPFELFLSIHTKNFTRYEHIFIRFLTIQKLTSAWGVKQGESVVRFTSLKNCFSGRWQK